MSGGKPIIDDTLKDLQSKRANNIISEAEYVQKMGINKQPGRGICALVEKAED